MRSDEELMAAYAAGDEPAFAELFARYSGVLLRTLARNLHRAEEARDLLQQTFLQLHRARFDYNPQQPFRPWVFTIALNLKREHLRRLRRRPEAGLEATETAELAVPSHGDRSEASQAIHHGLVALPREQREVIELHWFGGLSFSEVAEVVGATLSAVKVRAHRGYAALRRLLDVQPNLPSSTLSSSHSLSAPSSSSPSPPRPPADSSRQGPSLRNRRSDERS